MTAFREEVRSFIAAKVSPYLDEWEQAGCLPRALFLQAGAAGLLGLSGDFRRNAILATELGWAGAEAVGIAFTLQNDVVLPYLTDSTTEDQRRRWLPGVADGELVLAIAMTEPGAGSDLTGIRTRAVRDGEHYVVNGTKTFISNGQNADLFVTAVRTGPEPHRGLSLLVVESDTSGFTRGRNLDKIGLHAQDTSELTFTDARVPVANRLGEEGSGFYSLVHNLPQERLALALGAVGAAEGVFARTLVDLRVGAPAQHDRFVLAELSTELDVARTYVDDCVREHLVGELSPVRAAKVKWWTTELQVRVAERCLALQGIDGYLRGGRALLDARIQTIYGGTTEIMKEIIGKGLTARA